MGKKKNSGTKEMAQPKDNLTVAIGLLPILTQEFEKAKADKDHQVASKLRKQIWVVTDFSHGVVPDMPDHELRDILKDLPLTMPGEEPKSTGPPVQASQPSANSAINRLNKLRTRLEQIAALKAKQANGETLEKNQVDKIASEEEVRRQLAEMEELMATCS